jgi:hypothetical protein
VQHPLAHVLDRIDPEALYRTPEVAELLGLARSSVTSITQSG